MDIGAMRKGQKRAFDVIDRRFLDGEPYTSIILPTRYGKSDVIRCAAWHLFSEGRIPLAIALSPSELLRDQIVSKEKMDAWRSRYKVSGKASYGRLENARQLRSVAKNPNGEFLFSATTQLISRNVEALGLAIEAAWNRTGLPVLIQVDESHTGSEDNTWGQSFCALVDDFRARGIVYTATAIRSDGKIPPGFRSSRKESKAITIYKAFLSQENPGKYKVEKYSATECEIEIEADHETTFQEAWLEKPSPLLQIDWFPFDVRLGEIGDSSEDDIRMLSELSKTETRKVLGKVVKDSAVIRKGVGLAIEALRIYKATEPAAAMIVFCGNDDKENDKEANEHAKRIRSAIESIDRSLSVVIATSADGDGKEKIQQFKGDVLIVKQMASLGLDVPQFMVELDLSVVRTVAAQIQRDNRITTPFGSFSVATKIGPADVLSKEMFRTFVENNGGGKVITDLQLEDSYEPDPRDEKDKKVFVVRGTEASDFYDTRLNEAEKVYHDAVRNLFRAIPSIAQSISRAQAVTAFKAHGMTIVSSIGADEGIGSVDQEIDVLCEDINKLLKDITLVRIGGYRPTPEKKAAYQETIKAVNADARLKAGVDLGVDLRDIRDLEELGRLRAALDEMAETTGGGSRDAAIA